MHSQPKRLFQSGCVDGVRFFATRWPDVTSATSETIEQRRNDAKWAAQRKLRELASILLHASALDNSDFDQR